MTYVDRADAEAHEATLTPEEAAPKPLGERAKDPSKAGSGIQHEQRPMGAGGAMIDVWYTSDGSIFYSEADATAHEHGQAQSSVREAIAPEGGVPQRAPPPGFDPGAVTGPADLAPPPAQAPPPEQVAGRYGGTPGVGQAPTRAPTGIAPVTRQVNLAPAAAGTPDPGIAGQPTPTYDSKEQDALRDYRDRVLNRGDKVIDFLMGLEGPQQLTPEERIALAQRFQEQALSQQFAVASSARGGAGAVQSAMLAANQQTPQLAGAAAEMARQEAQTQFNQRVQAFNSLVGQGTAAGGVVQGLAGTAVQGQGVEATISRDAAAAGATIVSLALQQSGMQADIDFRQQELIGQMFLDLERLGLDYARLDADTQLALLADMTQRYGIDVAARTAIETAAKQQEKGVFDWIALGASTVKGVASVGTLFK
jgi:hypothetical protein